MEIQRKQKGGNRERGRKQRTRGETVKKKVRSRDYVRKEEKRPKTETLSQTISDRQTKKEKE